MNEYPKIERLLLGLYPILLSKTKKVATERSRDGFMQLWKTVKVWKRQWNKAFWAKSKNANFVSKLAFLFGGSGGIRTHEPVRTTWFRVRPVMTTSIPLPICSAAVFPRLFPMKKGFGKNWRKEQQIIQFFEPGKTRMVTRFLVDETDSSPQDFECGSLRPLRYFSPVSAPKWGTDNIIQGCVQKGKGCRKNYWPSLMPLSD